MVSGRLHVSSPGCFFVGVFLLILLFSFVFGRRGASSCSALLLRPYPFVCMDFVCGRGGASRLSRSVPITIA
jgi:hypothetical protein